jgi:hypothetical protein
MACGELVASAQDRRRMAKARNRIEGGDEGLVSLLAEVPEPLLEAMRRFIDEHPNWDQYRLFQAALAGFLVQHAPGDRTITRCYLANLFPGSARFQSAPEAVHALGDRPRLRPLSRPPVPVRSNPRLDRTAQAG